MTTISLDTMSDREVLERTVHVATEERHVTADLLTLLGECDARRLYLGEGCSSLFTYCTQVLLLSEHAAYHRIEAARAARQFPIILDLVAGGSVTLTTVALLRAHLTTDNHRELLAAARHRSKREVEHQIACLAPKPEVRAVIRRLPVQTTVQNTMPVTASPQPLSDAAMPPPSAAGPETPGRESLAPATPVVVADTRLKVAALAPDRFLLRITLNAETHARLRRAQQLMGHSVPDRNPAAVIDKALSLLVDQLERKKLARVRRPRDGSRRTVPASASVGGSRHIPAAMRREVWARDRGQCAFVGARGRCTETGRLEFHHVVPFARGGPTSVENLALRCRSHNAYESERAFGTQAEQGGRRMTESDPLEVARR